MASRSATLSSTVDILVGTSGYAYKEWKGSFYPQELSDKKMLGYYAQRFSTVEINNTFYRMPKESTLERWADEVPEGFTFVLKASRKITHEKRLKDVADPVGYLVRTSSALGQKLGPFLFQLPPYLRKDTARLRAFLQILPDEAEAALEFRHPSWFDEEVFGALRDYGVALCKADTGKETDAPLIATTSWGYLRLRRDGYSKEDLFYWSEEIHSQPWSRAFVFFKHEEKAAGPALAAELQEVLKV